MSLEGSLKTVALPEVLHLLADTSKTGELHVAGLHAAGRLWFDRGALSGFQVGRSEELVDALFDLLRIENGDFVFDSGATPFGTAHVPEGGSTDVRPPLSEAEARLVEWAEIVAVVPSLDHEVYLVEQAPESGVSLERDQWSLVVAVGEGRRVHDVLSMRGLTEFDGCKALKALVDASLVEVVEPGSAAAAVNDVLPPVEATEGAPAPAREALSAMLNGISEPAREEVPQRPDGLADRGPWTENELQEIGNWDDAEPEAAEAVPSEMPVASDEAPQESDESAECEEPINRGLLLKFLSSVRS